jgi:hypothetical protein
LEVSMIAAVDQLLNNANNSNSSSNISSSFNTSNRCLAVEGLMDLLEVPTWSVAVARRGVQG